eukprot:COSAG01_NODE_113_length_25617_cov_10.523492_25_plen_81_part_00
MSKQSHAMLSNRGSSLHFKKAEQPEVKDVEVRRALGGAPGCLQAGGENLLGDEFQAQIRGRPATPRVAATETERGLAATR